MAGNSDQNAKIYSGIRSIIANVSHDITRKTRVIERLANSLHFGAETLPNRNPQRTDGNAVPPAAEEVLVLKLWESNQILKDEHNHNGVATIKMCSRRWKNAVVEVFYQDFDLGKPWSAVHFTFGDTWRL